MAKFDLITTLTLNAAGYDQGINKAKQSTQDFKKTAENVGNTINKALSFVGLGVGVAGVMSLLKTSIQSVEGPGDSFAANMAGVKESLFELQRAIGSMDFSSLIDDLKEGFLRGKELEEALDSLADKKAYNDYIVIGYEQEAEALREITKNKLLEIDVRKQAADDILKIEEKIKVRKLELINEQYEDEKKIWEGRSKMTIEEGVKLFETMNNITKNGYNDVNAETIGKIQELFDDYIAAYGNTEKYINNAYSQIMNNLISEGNYDFIKNIPTKDLDTIASTFKNFALVSVGKDGESGIWEKLFQTINDKTKSIVTAQREYTSAIAETTRLLAMEKEAVTEVNEEVNEEVSQPITRVNSLPKIDISGLTLPSFSSKVSGDLIDPAKILNTKDWKSEMEKIGDYTLTLSDTFSYLSDTIINAAEDGKISFSEAMSIIARTAESAITILGALAAAEMIAAEANKGIIGIATMVVGLTSIASLWSSFVKPTPMAEGGLLYGPTSVIAGEYSNARSNPEVIAPLSKLKSLINSGGYEGNVRFEIEGTKLVGVLNNNNRKYNSFR